MPDGSRNGIGVAVGRQKKIEPMQFRGKRFSVKNTVAGGELNINKRADNSFIR